MAVSIAIAVRERIPLQPSAIMKLNLPSVALSVVPTASICRPTSLLKNPIALVMTNCSRKVACSNAPNGIIKISEAEGTTMLHKSTAEIGFTLTQARADRISNCIAELRNALQCFGAGSGRHLLVNPVIGALKAVAQFRRWLPAKNFLDQRVVAVAAVHAFGR